MLPCVVQAPAAKPAKALGTLRSFQRDASVSNDRSSSLTQFPREIQLRNKSRFALCVAAVRYLAVVRQLVFGVIAVRYAIR